MSEMTLEQIHADMVRVYGLSGGRIQAWIEGLQAHLSAQAKLRVTIEDIDSAENAYDRVIDRKHVSSDCPRLYADRDALAEAMDFFAARLSQGVPAINIKCETRSEGITGVRSLNVIRVEPEDDGSFTAVTDHWASQGAPGEAVTPTVDEIEKGIAPIARIDFAQSIPRIVWFKQIPQKTGELNVYTHPAECAAVPDGWEPTDAEVCEWMVRNDLEDQRPSQMRTAIDDARSMHMLSAAPTLAGKEKG